jgi:GDPmannose 4,6-dehydratase
MINRKIALASGIRGQDAAWLARLLLEKDWKVYGFERHIQSPDYTNIKEILDHPNFILEKADITDAGSVSRLVSTIKPDHFYHLAANSFVGCSWNEPTAVLNTNAGGTLNCLEAVRLHSPETKFLFASTSEVVGNSKDPIQNEETILTPHSPYAVAKAASEYYIKVYKFSHKLFCCYTRCYNHESKFRGKEFVTRKITDWLGKSWNTVDKNVNNWLHKGGFATADALFNHALNEGVISKLKLGNLNSSRDWLDARDCVRGMHMVLNQDKPDNFVLASGKMRSISEFLDAAFKVIGISDWKPFIGQDPKYLRPDDVVTLCGDYSKAKKILGWEPEISFETMVQNMVDNDITINGG